jgi:hypothetical protein
VSFSAIQQTKSKMSSYIFLIFSPTPVPNYTIYKPLLPKNTTPKQPPGIQTIKTPWNDTTIQKVPGSQITERSIHHHK